MTPRDIGPKAYGFFLRCNDGGYGWGETDQIAYTEVHSSLEEEAFGVAKRRVPGGWSVIPLGEVGNSPKLHVRHLNIPEFIEEI